MKIKVEIVNSLGEKMYRVFFGYHIVDLTEPQLNELLTKIYDVVPKKTTVGNPTE